MKSPDGPIFIGGLAHSGKTQLRLILDAHPDISMTRRTYVWHRFYGRYGDLRQPANLERCLAALMADEHVAQLDPDEDRLRRDFYAGPLGYPSLFTLLHRHHADRLGKRRWGDQLKLVERYADPIFGAIPGARMIHMVRDPRARRASGSERSAPRKGSLGWDTAMWLHSAELAERNQLRYADRYRVLTYEAFVERTHETLACLCAWLGEEYAAPMKVRVGSLHFDRRQRAADRRAELSFLDVHAGPAIAALGYERIRPRLTTPERLKYLASDWPVNRMTMAAWRAAHGRRLARPRSVA